MIHRYASNGKGHGVLQAIAAGDTSHIEVCRRLGLFEQPGPRRKIWYIIRSLCEDGYVVETGGDLVLTTSGQRALARLDEGETIEIDTDGRAAVMQGAA